MINTVLTGMLWLSNDDLTPEEMGHLIKTFTYQNPFDVDETRAGYILHKAGRIGVPAGSKAEVESLLGRDIAVVDRTVVVPPSKPFKTRANYELFESQELAVGEIVGHFKSDSPNVLLTAGTSSGKTFMLSGLLERIQQRTLVVSHLKLLGDQQFEELSAGLPGVDIGKIDSKTEDMPDVGIVTFQALARSAALRKRVRKEYGLLVIDEAENVTATSYLNVLMQSWNRYTLFMTATPRKELQGLTPLIQHLFSQTVEMVNANAIKAAVATVTLPFQAPYIPPAQMKMARPMFAKFLREDRVYAEILRVVLGFVKKPGSVFLVLSDKKLQDRFASQLNAMGIPAGVLASHIGVKDRRHVLEKLKEGSLKVICGSGTMSAGLSFPMLTYGVRVFPHSSSQELLEQQIGRLQRSAPHKEYVTPVWVDINFLGQRRAARVRTMTYEKLGLRVHNLTLEALLEKIKTIRETPPE